MFWRNESKESISTIYDHMFKSWKPAVPVVGSTNHGDLPRFPLVDVSYIQKLKAASIIK